MMFPKNPPPPLSGSDEGIPAEALAPTGPAAAAPQCAHNFKEAGLLEVIARAGVPACASPVGQITTERAIIDQHWMQQALSLARQAATVNEVPVGAVLVHENQLIGAGWNQPITHCDPTAHAEIVALRAGAIAHGNYRLLNTTLYVTLEPCAMCVGALLQARIRRLVFAALDPKAGAVASVFHLLDTRQLNHRIDWEGGCLAEESRMILQGFFQARRG